MFKGFLFSLCCYSALITSASANTGTDKIPTHPIEKIQIITEQFPPFNFLVNGVLKGASTEIMQAILKELSLDVSISLYPWARAYQMAKHLPNTVIFSMAKTPNRVELFQWGGALAPVESCFFSLAVRADIDIKTVEGAYKYSVTTQREGHTEHTLKQLAFVEGENLFSSVSADSSYRSLLTGRVDLWGFPTQVVNNTVNQDKNQKNEKLKKVFCFDVSYLYMAFSLGTPQSTIDKFNDALTKVKADGTYQQIIKRYGI